MAYGVKYRFQCESYNKTVYRVDLLEDGYSGAITTRPLGKAPVLRMQEAGPFRTTSCDIVLECQVDGEYVDLYTTDPFQYKVEVYWVNGNSVTSIWRGYIVTEIYSEPDIAPPYDVKITATDGLGILKEYPFEASGIKLIRTHICDLLKKAGDTAPMFYYASSLRKSGGTVTNFMDDANIDLDYMAGESCYDVLKTLLESLRTVIVSMGTYWLLVRESDAQIDSSGMLSAVQCIGGNTALPSTSTSVKMGKTVGKMGVADIWPVGFLNRRVIPAKKSVTVRMEWQPKNATEGLSSWTGSDDAIQNPTRWTLGSMGATGTISSTTLMSNFIRDVRVAIKASQYWTDSGLYGKPYVKVRATFFDGTTTYYYHQESGWNTSSPSEGDEYDVNNKNYYNDPAAADIINIDIPAQGSSNQGAFTIYVDGHRVEVYDVDVRLSMIKGYEDTIIIDNGARGTAGTIDITGGREMDSDTIPRTFVRGVIGSAGSSYVITSFSDANHVDKNFMSLAALAYARENAAPRIEITGTLNHEYDTQNTHVGVPVPFIKSHGVWALMKSYDWNMMTEDVSFTAVTLPSVTLEVEDEVITSIASGGSSSSGGTSGGGGGGGGSYTLPIASANTLGGVKVGSGLSIDQDGVLSSQGGGGGYTLPVATDGALGGIRIGFSQSGKNYPLLLDSNNKAYVNVPWEGGGSGGGGTVTRVAMTVPTGFSVAGSPIETSGTLAVSLDSQTKNKVLASPANASGTPSFRALVAADIPDLSGKYVTLDTTQNNISGEKTFTTKPVHIGSTSGIDVNGSSYIDIGEARLVYDSTNKALHITMKSGSSQTIGLYADGFVSARGAAASGDQIKFVALTGAQSVDGVKTFLANIIANGTITINGVTLTGSSSKLSLNKNASFAGISDRVNGSNTTHEVSIQDIVNRLVALENS